MIKSFKNQKIHASFKFPPWTLKKEKIIIKKKVIIVMWRILKVLILKSYAPNSKAPTNPKCEEY